MMSLIKYIPFQNAVMRLQAPPPVGVSGPLTKRHPNKRYVQYEDANQSMTSSFDSPSEIFKTKIRHHSLRNS